MRFKSLLLTPILIILSIIAIYALYAAFTSNAPIAWIGVTMAAVPLPATVSYLMARESLARTSANLPLAIAISGIGIALTLVNFAGLVPVFLAAAAFAMLAWYIFVYSRYGRVLSKNLEVGAPLPAFELESTDGTTIQSSVFLNRATLFLFYRGNWCPLCKAQISEVADAYKRLADLGVDVVLVSPQPPEQTAKLAKKFDVPFQFLIDRDHKAAHALDIFAEGGTPVGIDAMGYGVDTVLPTVIATDASGCVIFLDQTDNYRVRPEPETFLSIFENHLTMSEV